jgi:hypothetical protein
MKPDAVNLQSQPLVAPKPAAASQAPAEAQPRVRQDEDTFSYTKANVPKGVEVPMRTVQNVINNADDIGHTAVREASRASSWLSQSWIAKAVSWLPDSAGGFLNNVSQSKAVGLLTRVTQTPFFGAFSGVITKASPLIGLAMAPFDIKNMINTWKDPKALLPHKVLTSVRTVTGTLMCLGGVAAFALPALGFPAAGALALSWALKIGLVNLFASIPYWAKGIGSAVGWVGQKVGGAVVDGAKAVGGFVKKAFSAL